MNEFTYILEHDSTGMADYINKVDRSGNIIGYYCLAIKEWITVQPQNYVTIKHYKERFCDNENIFKTISEEEAFLEML